MNDVTTAASAASMPALDAAASAPVAVQAAASAPATELGFGHFISQTDAVGQGLFAILAHHARYGAAKLEEAGSAQDFLTRTIKKVLDEETMRMESGLTVLATIGATAPFVGLFGTVWGVYHALVAIGASGSGSLDKVAGPVGEALIMTGVGLAVAIPAVMAYNWLTRSNRVWGARLDAFAFELFTFLSTGHSMKSGDASKGAAVVSLNSQARN
ncbi:unnamed protein product [Victoria cruziana]